MKYKSNFSDLNWSANCVFQSTTKYDEDEKPSVISGECSPLTGKYHGKAVTIMQNQFKIVHIHNTVCQQLYISTLINLAHTVIHTMDKGTYYEIKLMDRPEFVDGYNACVCAGVRSNVTVTATSLMH